MTTQQDEIHQIAALLQDLVARLLVDQVQDQLDKRVAEACFRAGLKQGRREMEEAVDRKGDPIPEGQRLNGFPDKIWHHPPEVETDGGT